MKVRHIALEKGQSIERKHHAVTEGSVRADSARDVNAPRREAALDEQREQKAGRTGANNIDFHETTRS